MFNSQEFQKNKFILERIKLDYANTGTENSAFMHIAFNVNDKFVMQIGVAITSIVKVIPGRIFAFMFFVTV